MVKPRKKMRVTQRHADVPLVFCWVFALAFVLGGWQLSALALETPALPTPAEMLVVLLQYAPEMLPAFLISLERVCLALVFGVVLGAPLGLLLGRCKWADELFAPVLYILYPIPKIVLLPVLLVLMGLGGAPKIILIALTVFFQVVVVMRDAARKIPEQVIVSVRSLGGSQWSVWRYVVLPATLPELFTTLRVSSSVAIAVLFFAEAIVGSTGLGYFIMQSWSMVNYPRMFAGVVALALLGVVLYEVFDVAERLLLRYRRGGSVA